MSGSPTFERYLETRGIDIASSVVPKSITENDETLGRCAGAWKANRAEIEAVVMARVAELREELILRAAPYEVVILREKIVQLLTIFDDFEKLTAEFDRREADKKAAGSAK